MVSRPDAIALYSQGCTFFQQGALAEAAGLFRRALQLEPGSSEAQYNLACCLMQAGDLAGAAASFRELAGRSPGHADTLFNLGCVLRQLGQFDQAAKTFAQGLKYHPDDRECAFNLAAMLEAAGDGTGAIAAYRSCVARHPQFAEAQFNLSSLLIRDGHYEEASSLLADLHRRAPGDEKVTQNLARVVWQQRLEAAAADQIVSPRLLVACMPKSGSTFLTDLIARLPGMQRVHLVPEYGRREQELDLEQLVIHRDVGFVSQLHIRPSEFTLGLCGRFGIRPIFLYRNIWDVMASLRDHLCRHDLRWSMAHVDPEFRSWDETRQYEFLARTMMPWFVDFYVSWSLVPDKLAIGYERLMADPHSILARIAEWAGIAADPREIDQALAAVGRASTFNKGGSGRGSAVPETARAHVEAVTSYYPQVDFTPLLAG